MGFIQFFPRLAISSEKVAFYTTRTDHLVNQFQFKIPPRIMNFKYRTLLHGVSTMKNNFIYEVTEEVMQQLITAGIPIFFSKYIEDVILRAPPTIPQEVQKFKIEDLKFSFIIYWRLCAISFLVFVIEILVFNVRKYFGLLALKRIKNLTLQ